MERYIFASCKFEIFIEKRTDSRIRGHLGEQNDLRPIRDCFSFYGRSRESFGHYYSSTKYICPHGHYFLFWSKEQSFLLPSTWLLTQSFREHTRILLKRYYCYLLEEVDVRNCLKFKNNLSSGDLFSWENKAGECFEDYDILTSGIFSTCFLFLSNFPFGADVSRETIGVLFSNVLGTYFASQSRSENLATLRWAR